jgi:molecular chaperone GrpE
MTNMTEDLRDAARQAMGGDDADKREDLPVTPAPEAGDSAEEFAAETAHAETLEPAPGDAPAGEPREDAAGLGEGRAPKVPDYKDKWLRAEAELQNSRRRAQRDRDDAVRSAEDRILLDLIELLDDVERALAVLTSEQAADPWTQGVTLTAQRMRDALVRRGVSVIATQGQPFDPAFHEALLEVPAPEGIAPGCVAQEVLKGYRRGERALRAARVVVARADA